MAKTANSENLRREAEGPNWKETIDLIRGPIRSNGADTSKLGQENGTFYKRIEKQYGVHRGAAKDFAKIDLMAPEKRTDYLRSLIGLCRQAKFTEFNDLVDQAQAPAKAKTKGKPAAAPDALDGAPRDEDIPLDDPSLDPAVVAEQRDRESNPMFDDGDNVTQLRPN